MDNPAKRRLALNEVIHRTSNRTAQERIQEDIPAEDHGDLELHFFCECSREVCESRIVMSCQLYDRLHESNKHFIAIPGHENQEVETVVKQTRKYVVVEKFVDPSHLRIPKNVAE